MSEPRDAGDWILEHEIGSGSFAKVWKATHRHTRQIAAVKEINVDKLNKKLQESLASEVAVLNHTKHHNIVCLLDLIRDNNRLFIVLEFCAGGDLGHYIKRYRQASEATARYFLRQLAEGLKELRRHNVIHRDLKPQNLLLSDSSSTPLLKIADFGFARSLAPQGLAETLCGSPLYMAPEILQFHKYDAKADLWSIGTILFELLVGKPPFNGANHMQLLRNIERNDAKLPEHVAARLSGPCKSLLGLLLQRKPVERISFEEFFTHPFLSGNTGPTVGVPPSQPIPAAQSTTATAALPAAMRQAAVAVAAANQASAVGMPRPSLHLHAALGAHTSNLPQAYTNSGHTQVQQQQQPWQPQQYIQQQQQLTPVQSAAMATVSYMPPMPPHNQQRQQPFEQQQHVLVAQPVDHHPLDAAGPGAPGSLSDSMEDDFVVVHNPNGSAVHKNSSSNSSSSKASSGLVDPKAAAVLQSAAPAVREAMWRGIPAQQQQQHHHQQQHDKQRGQQQQQRSGFGQSAAPLVQTSQERQQPGLSPATAWATGNAATYVQAVAPGTAAGVSSGCMPAHSQLDPGIIGSHSLLLQPTAAQQVQLLVQVIRGCVNLLLKQTAGCKDTVLPATQQSEHLSLMLLSLQLVQAMCSPHTVQVGEKEASNLHQSDVFEQQHNGDDVCSLPDMLAVACAADLEQLMSAAVDLLALVNTLPNMCVSSMDDAADQQHDAAASEWSAGKVTESPLQLPLPDPFVVLYQQALDICRSAAVEEVMGNWQGSVAGYSLAADLLLFLSYEWKQLGTADPGLLAEDRHALRKLYDAVNGRLAAVVAEAPSAVLL